MLRQLPRCRRRRTSPADSCDSDTGFDRAPTTGARSIRGAIRGNLAVSRGMVSPRRGRLGKVMATRRAKQPPPTVVLFVRHARTPTTGSVLPGRAPGLHLADGGRTDADKMAAQLASTAKIEAVYASPLERAKETAEPIARRLGLKVTVERGLVECDFGEWTGGELKALRKLPEWRGVQSWPSGFRFPSGESFPEMQCRVTSAVARLLASQTFPWPGVTDHAPSATVENAA